MRSRPASPRKIPNLRWLIAGLVFWNTVHNYVDRQALSVVAPQLVRDLNLSNVAYGYIVQAFLVAYTAMYFLSGIAIDRWGVKFIYAVATAWWSAAAMLHAAARSSLALGLFRSLLGVGESANFIAAEKVASEWYPPRERALLNGLVQAAAVTGAVVTPPLVVWLALGWGWRAAFLVTGGIVFLWLVPWSLLYHLPEQHPRITDEELRLLRPTTGPAAAIPPRYAELLRRRETWGLLIARVFSDPVWWFYLFWLPKYLTESRGMTLAQVGMTAWIPYLASDAGSIAGGWSSGRLVRRGRSAVGARKLMMLASVLAMPLGILLVGVRSNATVLALIAIVLFAHMSWKTNLVTLTVDIFPQPVVASAAGIVATGSGVGGALFTMLAGYLIDRYSYAPVLVLMGFLHPVAYPWVRALVREPSHRAAP